MTKNASTPTNPPVTFETPKWKAMTPITAIALNPSTSGRNLVSTLYSRPFFVAADRAASNQFKPHHSRRIAL